MNKMMNKNTDEVSPSGDAEGDFLRIVKDLDRGKFLADVAAELARVARACEEYGGKGEVRLVLRLDTDVGESASTTITGEVRGRAPQRGCGSMVRFCHAGRILRTDPDQGELGLVEDSDDDVVVRLVEESAAVRGGGRARRA